MGLFKKISDNFYARNIVIAVCGIIVFVFIISVLLNTFTRHGQRLQVPDFRELTLDEAIEKAKKQSLALEVMDSVYRPSRSGGVVLEQLPGAGSYVKSGRRILLTVNSFRPREAQIPYVTGYSLRQAKNKLETAGFGIDKIVYRSDMATNNVLDQMIGNKRIESNTPIMAELGSNVTLVVGLAAGAPLPKVPRAVGYNVPQAKSRVWEMGLNISEIIYDKDIDPEEFNQAKVYKQEPREGLIVNHGQSVKLYVTLNDDAINKGIKDSEKSLKTVEEANNKIIDSLILEGLNPQQQEEE